MMYFRTSLRAAVLLSLASLAPCGLSAQSLGLAPAQVVQDFKPGVPFELELNTVNRGGNPVEMSVSITDFWYNENNEKIFTAPGTSPRSAANWIQFLPEHFQVDANGDQKMKAIVTPPVDAKGGYYAVLFVESKPRLSFDKTADGKQVYTNMRLGCLVLLNAEKTAEYKIEVSDAKVTPPTETQGIDVSFMFHNQSNTHVFPLPRVAVLDANHKMVAKADGDMKRFLPGQKDAMHVQWAGTLPAGTYTAILTISYADDRIETRELPFTVGGK